MLAAIASQQSLVRMSDHEARRHSAGERTWGEAAAAAQLRSRRVPSGAAAMRQAGSRRLGRPADVSLDHALGSDAESPLVSFLADGSTGSPEEILLRSEARDVVRSLLCGLPRRHREILRLRFGFDGGDPTTLQEAGERVGLTRERVRQIERQSLARIRRGLVAGWSGSLHGGAKGQAPEPPGVSNGSEDGTPPARRSRPAGTRNLLEPEGELASTA
jgi:RNA polymerase sigma factor (sigma-70 family)